MARPLRIEFPDALYHVTSRGDRREAIFTDDSDRAQFLTLLGETCERFDAAVLAWCLMGNHYHLVLNTRAANLSQLMRHLNGVYTQRFNRRHGKVGHVFQGRFKAILVDRDAYLLAVCRYVDLNPVRAGLVAAPQDWAWSSCRALTGRAQAPPWLDTRLLHALLVPEQGPGGDPLRLAQQRYAEALRAGRDATLWPGALRQQVYLGSEDFVQRMQARATAPAPSLAEAQVPRRQRAAPVTLQQWLDTAPSREQALLWAHQRGGMTLTAMAAEIGLSLGRVSQLVAKARLGEGSGL
jgi:REP element-mobilizing transposase RayT